MKKTLLFSILSFFLAWKLSSSQESIVDERGEFVPDFQKADTASKRQFNSPEFERVQILQIQRQEFIKSKEDYQSIQPNDVDANQEKFHKVMQEISTNREAAISLLHEIIEDDPYHVLARAQLSDILLGESKLEEAREHAIHCLVEDEANHICHRTLVSTYTRKGQLNEAYPYLSDCLAIIPDHENCLSAMTNYHLSDNNLEEAEIFLAQLEDTHPDSIWTAGAQANFFDKKGEPSEALKFYKIACEKGQAFACQRVQELM